MVLRFFSIFIIALIIAGCKSANSNSTNSNTNYTIPASTTWQWQLQGVLNLSYDAKVYDIDLFDTSKETILELKNSGKTVICYFSAGSWENFREDKDDFLQSVIGNTLDGWEEENWLDIRSNSVRDIMKKRLDLAQEKGCDGVEPDNVDGYTNDTGFNLGYEDQIDYNKFLAQEAHSRGLSIGLKNDLNQIDDLVDYFDFSVNEQCYEFNECDKLKPFIDNNKAVFEAEYKEEYKDDEEARKTVCKYLNDLNISALILPIDLDDSFRYSCQDIN